MHKLTIKLSDKSGYNYDLVNDKNGKVIHSWKRSEMLEKWIDGYIPGNGKNFVKYVDKNGSGKIKVAPNKFVIPFRETKMIKLKNLLVEKINYNKELSRDERLLLQKFQRGAVGNKAGDFETKDIDVPLESEYKGDIQKIKKTPVWKSGPAKGLPQTERTGRAKALFYKGKEIMRHKEGPFYYPQDLVKNFGKKVSERYNGGIALVADKPYDRKLRIALGFFATKTVAAHWVDETPLKDIKKIGLK